MANTMNLSVYYLLSLWIACLTTVVSSLEINADDFSETVTATTTNTPTTSTTADACTDLTCQHGGLCRTWQVNDNENNKIEYCFCDDYSEGRFVGVDCSIPAPTNSADWCNPYGDFCVNGGTCIENNTANNNNKVCDCPEGYTGRYCDLEVAAPQIQAHVSNEHDDFEDACNLQCANGGTCEYGHRPTSMVELTNDPTITSEELSTNFQHCVCPDGFFGPTCESTVQICGYDDDHNPEHVCHNGAQCMSTSDLFPNLLENNPNLPPYMCDCDSISTSDKIFTGKYCEIFNVHICDKADLTKTETRAFCANGGLCIKKGKTDEVIWGCRCRRGFDGPHCEYTQEDEDDNEPDTTPAVVSHSNPLPVACQNPNMCENGGQCVPGAKDTSHSTLGQLVEDRPDLQEVIRQGSGPVLGANQDYEHCSCPEGLTGVFCQVQFELCLANNSADHVCFRGSTCTDAEEEGQCSCHSDNSLGLGGKYCQFEATSKCEETDSWCFNDGKCQPDGTCQCNDEWHGIFCDIPISEELKNTPGIRAGAPKETTTDENNYIHSYIIMICTMIALVALVLGFAALVAYDRRHKYQGDAGLDYTDDNLVEVAIEQEDTKALAVTKKPLRRPSIVAAFFQKRRNSTHSISFFDEDANIMEGGEGSKRRKTSDKKKKKKKRSRRQSNSSAGSSLSNSSIVSDVLQKGTDLSVASSHASMASFEDDDILVENGSVGTNPPNLLESDISPPQQQYSSSASRSPTSNPKQISSVAEVLQNAHRQSYEPVGGYNFVDTSSSSTKTRRSTKKAPSMAVFQRTINNRMDCFGDETDMNGSAGGKAARGNNKSVKEELTVVELI